MNAWHGGGTPSQGAGAPTVEQSPQPGNAANGTISSMGAISGMGKLFARSPDSRPGAAVPSPAPKRGCWPPELASQP